MNTNLDLDYTNNQGKYLYDEYLQAIRLKISQITLYDPETAIDLLSDYNEIIKNNSKKTMEIVKKINSLEQKIADYEKEKGSKIKLKEQQQIIYDMIDELDRGSYLVSLDECLDAFSDLRKKYMEIEFKDFQECDFLNIIFHKLQADLVARVVREKTDIVLEDLIQKEDESGLKIAISQKINELLQSKDVGEKNRAQKMKNIMITDQNCLHSLQLWQLMNGTEFEIVSNNKDSLKTNELPSVYNSGGFATKIQSFIKRILGLFRREQTTGMKLSDLAKIDMDWLVEQIKKNQSVLEENERLKLKVEGRKNVDKIFIPDAKTPIYDFFDGNYDSPFSVLYDEDGDIIKDYKYDYIDDNGLEKKLIITGEYIDEESDMSDWIENYKFICRGAEKIISYDGYVHLAIKYVQFIDKLLGTDLTGKMLCELEECELKESFLSENKYISYKGKKWKVLDKILKSYNKMKENYKKTRFNFRGSEEKRRERFYQQYSFLEDIVVDENNRIYETEKSGFIEDKSKKIQNTDNEQGKSDIIVDEDENIGKEIEEHD